MNKQIITKIMGLGLIGVSMGLVSCGNATETSTTTSEPAKTAFEVLMSSDFVEIAQNPTTSLSLTSPEFTFGESTGHKFYFKSDIKASDFDTVGALEGKEITYVEFKSETKVDIFLEGAAQATNAWGAIVVKPSGYITTEHALESGAGSYLYYKCVVGESSGTISYMDAYQTIGTTAFNILDYLK